MERAWALRGKRLVDIVGASVGLVILSPVLAVAAGADGILLEMHPHPSSALSDGGQSLDPVELVSLVAQLREVARSVGRQIS